MDRMEIKVGPWIPASCPWGAAGRLATEVAKRRRGAFPLTTKTHSRVLTGARRRCCFKLRRTNKKPIDRIAQMPPVDPSIT